MNRQHFDGSLKDLRGPHRKLAATAAAHQHPSLRATLHEWPLAFWRQMAQHQHAIALRAGGALGNLRGRVVGQNHGASSWAMVAAGDNVGWTCDWLEKSRTNVRAARRAVNYLNLVHLRKSRLALCAPPRRVT